MDNVLIRGIYRIVAAQPNQFFGSGGTSAVSPGWFQGRSEFGPIQRTVGVGGVPGHAGASSSFGGLRLPRVELPTFDG